MKGYKLFGLFLFFTSWTQQQFGKAEVEHKQQLQLTIVPDKDTFLLGEKIIVNAQLLNKTNKILMIPKNYTLTSNLYPNGISNGEPVSGSFFDFQVSPMSKWAGIYVEDIVIQKDREFIPLGPDSAANFRIDIGQHINSFNKDIIGRSDSLKIKGGFDYDVKMTYSTKKDGAKDMFFGQVQSNEIKIFLK